MTPRPVDSLAPAPGGQPRAHEPAPRPAGPPRVFGGLRLLVADDEEAVRDSFDRYFSRLGASVSVAADGREALELIRGKEFDAILLDLKMPVMTGWEVVQATRRERPELASRIVIVSGDITGLLELQTAEHLEPWRMLEKPADLETIRQAVARASQIAPRN